MRQATLHSSKWNSQPAAMNQGGLYLDTFTGLREVDEVKDIDENKLRIET